MLDSFVSKRLFSFVVALLCFSVIVVFMEEYAEDDLQPKFTSATSGAMSSVEPNSPKDCWMHENTVEIEPCERCSDFEIRALKAKHCVQTGFSRTVNCSRSGTVVHIPCKTSLSMLTEFHVFGFINIILLTASFLLARKRIAESNKRAYMRVAQFFEPSSP